MTAAAIVTLQMRRGVSWLGAVADASECMEIGERVIERAYETYRDQLLALPDDTLLMMIDQPLPPS